MLAHEAGISYATFQNWILEGMPREKGAARNKWIQEKKRKPKQETQAASNGLTEEKRALSRIRRKRELLDYLTDKKKLVFRKAVEQRLRKFFTDARVQLETIPNVVARFVPEGENQALARKMVTNIIHNVLKGLASAR